MCDTLYNEITDFDKNLLEAAHSLALKCSPDPSKKIGAIFVDSNCNILSYGANEPAEGLEYTELDLSTNETKDQYIVHAEKTAIDRAAKYGIPLFGSTLYVYGLPMCNGCALSAINVGVSRIVVQQPRVYTGRWKESSDIALVNLMATGVNVDRYDLDWKLIDFHY